MADFAREQTGEKNLIFCGGCAQNCVVAGKLRKSGMYEGVFNSPDIDVISVQRHFFGSRW
ncbi:MAG: carbamoyltransferase N-terminal domain-containing protein [Hyphomicrobiaceae bacterium]